MAEGEKREGADDLFEDLDKFFAPIKDVDWPEEPAEPEVSDAGSGPAPEEPVVVPSADDEEPAPEPTEPARAGGDDVEPAEAVWYDTESMDTVTADDDVAGDEGAIPATDPGPSEVPGQADLFPGGEDDAAGTEPPSDEDVEAAAEHFAASIRSETAAHDEGLAAEAAEAAEEPEVAAGPTVDEGDLLGDLGAADVERDILADLDEPSGGRTVRVGAEGLGGPSWQDPTSVEVGADLDRQGGRDVPAAFATGLVLAAAAFGGLLLGRGAFAVVAAIIVLVAQGELFGVMHRHRQQPATAVGLVTGALILWAAYDRGEGAVLGMFALGTIATLLWYMAVPAIHRKDTLVNVGLTTFNIASIPLLGSFLLLALSLGTDGRGLVFAVILLTFAYDTVAFLAGSIFGGSMIQRPLAPDTSPKKSWEGLIAAVLVTVIVSAAVVGTFVRPFEDAQLKTVVLGLVVGLAATFGDLAESLVKRDLGIKDMGSVLPGHGGVLDRIDSLLFTGPAAYLLFRILFS